MEKYANEIKEKWGNTEAYREVEKKMKHKTSNEIKNMTDALTEQFSEMGKIKQLLPESQEAQSAVKALQDFITANFYTCTKEILSGLGEMYMSDDRFRNNIDSAGGLGTAEFVGNAIKIYCK